MTSPQNRRRVAVRLPNWLGDTLMAFPLLRALSNAGVDFTCFGHPWAADIFAATGFDVVADARVRKKMWLARRYRQGRFTDVLLCPHSWSAVLPALLAGVATSGYHPLCKTRVAKRKSGHRVQQYFELGRSIIGDAPQPDRSDDFIPLSAASEREAERLLAGVTTGPFVVVCPYAANLHKGMDKEWPHWRRFIHGAENVTLLGLVAPEDKPRFEQEYPDTAVMTAKLSVTAAIMRRAAHVITNDSGAMHLASFFGAKVVGLLGITDHSLTHPWFGSYLSGADAPWVSLEVLRDHVQVAAVGDE